MTDMVVQYIDNVLLERIRGLARERQCSLNEVMLQALRCGVGIYGAQAQNESQRDAGDLTQVEMHWARAERDVFHEALRALAQTRPTQFAPEVMAYASELPGGAG